MDVWNPSQYNRFQNERSAPFWDLSALVDFSSVKVLLDVGCGTGELTRDLVRRAGVPEALGIDSSAKMLADAAEFSGAGLRFEQARVEEFAPASPFDVVFSNAALQWVENHQEIFPRVLSWVRPGGGQLAVQMPFNFDHPSHVLAEELGARFGLKVRRSPVLAPEDYAGLLDGPARDVNVFVKVYLHHLPSSLDVVEWTKGTLLTFYEKQLPTDGYAKFLQEYTRELQIRLGTKKPYLYTFKRLFIHARRN